VREGDSLLYVLRRTYADPEGFGGERRNDNLERLLRQRIAHLNRQEIESLLGDLCARLSTKASPVGVARPSRPVEPAELASPSLPSAGEELARKDFLELVRQYCQESSQPLSREMLEQVYRRIGRVLQIVFTGLASAIKGRREFQREFEVEATRILAWTPNPIKSAENAAEIGSLLLDPRSQGLTEDQVAVHLQEVFQDLTLHQLGLMAGFRECVRGLLKELDPAVLAKSEKGGSVGNRMGLLGGNSARAEAAAWRRFLEKYRQLTEEEVRVFERILAPHFAKGYLSIQKTHRRR
jgi:predicted component of type VI protein secretion system